jgi:hypothetical protein
MSMLGSFQQAIQGFLLGRRVSGVTPATLADLSSVYRGRPHSYFEDRDRILLGVIWFGFSFVWIVVWIVCVFRWI